MGDPSRPGDTAGCDRREPPQGRPVAGGRGHHDNFYYLYSHEDSRDSFQIGHDLLILEALFKLGPGDIPLK